jgi:LysM repeat protein
MTHTESAIETTEANRRAMRTLLGAGAIAAAIATLATVAGAQRGVPKEPEALHGSKASVEKMYEFAESHHYPFYLTPTNVDTAIAQGKLVALTGDSTYELTRGVGFSYATREVKRFVELLAPQYLYACGAPLTVTSAARPLSNQPHNANPHSVHPTGIAVDIRRPPPGPCLTWVRGALAQLEAKGIVEATEEHHPIHLHVAVLQTPGSKFTLPNLVQGMVAAARVPAAPAAMVTTMANGEVSLPATGVAKVPRTYVVRQGDTVYDIASKTGVSVKALLTENNRTPHSVLKPGTTLRIPNQNGQ